MSVSSFVHEHQSDRRQLLIIERFLRDREGVWQQIQLEYRLGELTCRMLATSTICLGGYGVVMGLFHGVPQAISSAIKLPVVFLLTLAICLPLLYFYNLLFAGRLSAQQLLALVLSAITVTATFTLSFAPIVLFLLITARSYLFFNLLNVTVLALTGLVGVQFLVDGVATLNMLATQDQEGEDSFSATRRLARRPVRPVSARPLSIWILVYGFVGTQLGWTLRPFIGNPESNFRLFSSVEGSFYDSIFYMILNLLH